MSTHIRRVHLTLTVWSHAPRRGQPRDVAAVDLAPDAARRAWCEPLQKRVFVERLLEAWSIQPQYSATSRACAYVTVGRPEAFW